MSSARWTAGVALLLGCLPVAILQACGGTGGNGTGSHGDGGASDDGTVGDGSEDDGTQGGGDSGGKGDGSFGNDGGPCVPGCPASVTCGRYTDCTGHTLSCGMPCPNGKACITSGSSQSCQTPACKVGDAASKCGEIAVDSCGVPVNCGGCPAGETCVNNACTTQPPPADGGGGGCGKLSCAPAAGVNLCGTVSDGCGNTKQCTCPTGQDCTGGVCTAPPPECTGDDGGTGSKCGTISNACGSGQVQCAGCTGNNKCDNGTCTACTPVTCGSTTCGEVASNGCGPGVSCGTCSGSAECFMGTCCTPQTCAEAVDAGIVTGCGQVNLGCGVSKDCAPCGMGQVCRGGACCTPQTCAEAVDAGIVTGCNPVDLGCGVQQSCMTCVAGQLCQNDTCVNCMPKTCADFSGGCGHGDGCGHTLDCCASGTTCMSGNVCCQAGEVVYQGSCCLPQCNPNLPAGPQDSCGTVIYCSGGGGSQ
jgi:hypothetical protein